VQTFTKSLIVTTFLLFFCPGLIATVFAAPQADLWPRWQANEPQSSLKVDHSAWGRLLDSYLVVSKTGSANLVRYAAVSRADKADLALYIASLGDVPMARLERAEQRAVWINLYNALTVQTILTHYPVQSIRDIGSGWFSSGPWDMKMVRVGGVELSLNDIEHRILRPIWQDNRVHYAVNCASLGCPNLQPEPFTAQNSERLLNKAAKEFINSPRGATVVGGRLILSSIYDWFQADFGVSEATLIDHLEIFATPALVAELRRYRGAISYKYDWGLNGAQVAR
jgi:hypothetical protein